MKNISFASAGVLPLTIKDCFNKSFIVYRADLGYLKVQTE